MEQETENEIIRETIKELIGKMGFTCEVENPKINEKSEETRIFNVKADESSFLIGQHGVNMQSLQHIARVLIRKKLSMKTNFVLDINSYRQEKNNSLVKLARAMADQAIREKRAIVLRPMSPYERRIVHTELSNDSQIKTESIGEGGERKVVISPLILF
jgi:spoIIIJ-associated protein